MIECNILLLGNSDLNENLFISKHALKNTYVTGSTTNVSRIEYYTNDWLIQENNFSVTVNIKKIHLRELEDYLEFGTEGLNLLFIVAFDFNKPGKVSDYAFSLLSTIKKYHPKSIVLYVTLNETPKIRFKKINSLKLINENIRGIIKLSTIKNQIDEDIELFRYVLAQIIVNRFTPRLQYVRQLISENLAEKNPSLDLGNCGLTSFDEIPELYNCVHLEELIISNEWAEYKDNKWRKIVSNNPLNRNNFNFLTPDIAKLKNLKKLIAGGDWKPDDDFWYKWSITDLQLVTKLKNLEYLNISNNSIKYLASLNSLKKLKVVHLNNNEINQTYESLKIDTLEAIYLSNNKLSNVSFLKDLQNIKTLDLHANNITDLRPLATIIEKIGIVNSKWEQGTISVYKNKLSTPPVEIIANGLDAVLQYFKDLQNGESFINKEIKLVLVGNSEVGKTTLAKYLNDEKDLDKEHYATHWLEELQVKSKHIIDKINEKCNINIFDFGGHDFYHDTHHLFFSSNTLYIILWDGASNSLNQRYVHSTKSNEKVITQDYPLKYWLDSIKYFSKEKKTESLDSTIKQKEEYNSRGLVIQNKVVKKEDIVFLNQLELTKSYPFIYDFVNMAMKPIKRNLEYFDSILAEVLNNTEIIGTELPEYFGIVKDKIQNNDNLETIVSIVQFKNFCNSFLSIQLSLEQTKNLALYLRNIGIILYYPKNDEDLPIYLNKTEIVRTIHKVLGGLVDLNGEFDENHIDQIIGQSEGYKKAIIDLMINFKMIFKHPESNLYIAPLYLPSTAADSIELFIDDNKTPYRRFFYKGFIHKSVILEFYQEYGKYVLSDKGEDNKSKFYYWKDGLIIRDELTREVVMIRFYLGDDDGNAHIDVIRLNKEGKSVFVDNVIKYINEINKDIDGFEERVTIDGNDYIELKLLNENAKEGRLIFTGKSLEEKNTNSLNVQNKIYKLKDYMDYIDNGIKRKKVVISYSKKDLAHVHTLRRYLKPLVDLELIEEPWYCTLLNPADEWDEKIQSKFEEADIVIFMISEYFYSTKYIIDKEIKTTIDRYKNGETVKIIPIILEFYDWERKEPYNLKQFTALPYQAKPISDFKNPKLAWSTITTSLKVMIEKDLDPGVPDTISRDLEEIYERQVMGKLDI